MSDHLIVPASGPTRQGEGRHKPRVTVVQLLFRALQRWQRNRAMANLQGLSDGQLEDIGISRNDIPRVADGFFQPKGETVRAPAVPEEPSSPLRKAA